MNSEVTFSRANKIAMISHRSMIGSGVKNEPSRLCLVPDAESSKVLNTISNQQIVLTAAGYN